MYSLKNSTIFFLVTILTIVTAIIKAIGKDKIRNYVYRLSLRTRSGKKELESVHDLKKEQLEVNRERQSISAQDNYAKWTKLNRKFNKLSDEIKDREQSMSKTKAQLDLKVDKVITFFTVVPNNLLRLWYSRVALLYLPNGLLPFFIDAFVINFPFLPRGSVGVVFWSLCLGKVVDVLIGTLKYFFFTRPATDPALAKKIA